jgi:hypothetical protein
MAGLAFLIIAGSRLLQILVRIVAGGTFQFPFAFVVATTENQSLGRKTNGSAVQNGLGKIGQWCSMANSTELELFVSSKLAGISNGQTLLRFPLRDHLDMLLPRPVAAFTLDYSSQSLQAELQPDASRGSQSSPGVLSLLTTELLHHERC